MTSRTRKLLLALAGMGVLVAFALTGIFSAVVVEAPHMVHQPHLRTFEAIMPLPPQGSLPVEEDFTEEIIPPAGTKKSIARGAVYYGYYCLACHGEKGDGNGPVGESYMPAPTNLTGERISRLEDRELVRAMLHGIGHEPVLPGLVPPEHTGYLVVYVKSLAGK